MIAMVSPKDQMINAPIGMAFSLIFKSLLIKSENLITAFSGTNNTKKTIKHTNEIANISSNKIIINNSPLVANI
jgi:hypothetical protein